MEINTVIWPIIVASLAMGLVITNLAGHLKRRIAGLVKGDWSERGLDLELERIGRVIAVALFFAAFIAAVGVGFIGYSINYGTIGGTDPSKVFRATDPPEWICRD